MTQYCCSLPVQFILERIKETRLEMISTGDWFIWETEIDNRRVSMEAISLLLLLSCFQQTLKDGILLNT